MGNHIKMAVAALTATVAVMGVSMMSRSYTVTSAPTLSSDKSLSANEIEDLFATKVGQKVRILMENDKKIRHLFVDEVSAAEVVEADEDVARQAREEVRAERVAEESAKERAKESAKEVQSTPKASTEEQDVTPASQPVVVEEPQPVEAKTASVQEQRSPSHVEEDDYALFIAIVDVEASGEPYEAKLAIANVILNRKKSGNYGRTIQDIVYAPGQFPPAHNGVLSDRLEKGPWSSDSKRAVDEALAGKNNISTAKSFNMYYGQSFSGHTEILGTTIFYNF